MRDDEPMVNEELTRSLKNAVLTLRQADAVSDLWRARLLADVRRASVARGRRRRATLAAAVILIVGAGSVVLNTHERAGSEALSNATMSDTAAIPVAQLTVASPVRFALEARGARNVALVGDFDGWKAQGRPMHRSADGRTWEVDVLLPPGRHAFAYIVDGVLRADPAAARAVEDDFGVPSSVIVVASRGI